MRWVGVNGGGGIVRAWGGGGATWEGQFLCDFLKTSETACVIEKLERVEMTEK